MREPLYVRYTKYQEIPFGAWSLSLVELVFFPYDFWIYQLKKDEASFFSPSIYKDASTRIKIPPQGSEWSAFGRWSGSRRGDFRYWSCAFVPYLPRVGTDVGNCFGSGKSIAVTVAKQMLSTIRETLFKQMCRMADVPARAIRAFTSFCINL